MAIIIRAPWCHAGLIIPKASEALAVINVETVGDQTLHWYGLANEAPPSPFLTKKACGDNKVDCDSRHQASTRICGLLWRTLVSSGGRAVPRSPRAVCLSQRGEQCCTSWAREVPRPLFYRDLAPAVQKISTSCAGNRVSGLSRDTNLAGTCTTQCLSNRADGCR